LKGALGHALKTELRQDDRARLEEFMNNLPSEVEAEGQAL
jgi:hypothetical protein